MLAHGRLCERVIVAMRRKCDERWSKGERVGVVERKRQHGGWMEMRVEGSILGTLLLRRGVRGLESDCRYVWHGKWGKVGRNGTVCVGWCYGCDENCEYD